MGLLLSDFNTANIASALNHESAGGRRQFFSWVLNLERFVFNKGGWAKGKGGVAGLVFMHSVYDATYLHRPACSILQSFSPVYFGYMYLGGAATGEAFRACLAKHSLCRPYFIYVSTYQRYPIRYSFSPPPSFAPKLKKKLSLQKYREEIPSCWLESFHTSVLHFLMHNQTAPSID